MTFAKNYNKSFLFPLAVYFVLGALIIGSGFFAVGKYFYDAVSIDLIITAPLLYLIAARKFKTRLLFIFPLIALGFMLSKILLPSETSALHLLSKWLLPFLELMTIGSISFYTYRFYREAKMNKEVDVLTIIRRSTKSIFGDNVLSKVLSTEFAVVYYAFFARRKKRMPSYFTVYRDNNSLVLYGFVVFIILAETIAFHFLFVKINMVFAWLMFGLSLYFALQIFAHARALTFRCVEIGEELIIRYGLAGDVVIRFDQIQNIVSTTNYKVNSEKQVVRLGLLKTLEGYSVALELKESVSLESFYGISKSGNVILLPIDNCKEFVNRVNEKILL
jgi:hypothetical protein